MHPGAEDNDPGQLIRQEVFGKLGLNTRLFFVRNGEVVLNYLHGKHAFTSVDLAPWLDLILMDLNMPRMNGQEAIEAIRSEPKLRDLPTIELTTSTNPARISHAYASEVNAFHTKAGQFDDFVDFVRKFCDFWLAGALLPPAPAGIT